MMAYDTPIYNLKAVVQQTGVKADTLRAWERRYGLPQPERTDGGHRLFSQRDIDTVKWLVARQQEGVRINHAVELWRELASADAEPPADAPSHIPPHPTGTALADLRQAWVAAAVDFDEQEASHVLEEAFALYSPETVSLEVLQKGMAQIGAGWHAGSLSVQQEHFASELAMRRLQSLIMSTPPPSRAGQLVVAAPPEESHALGLLLLTFLLRRRGWQTTYLGVDVPIERIEATVAATTPQLVILGAQRLPAAATLRDMARSLQHYNVPVGFGGRIFNMIPDLIAAIPGHYLGRTLDRAPDVIEGLLVAPRQTPESTPLPANYRAALSHYRERELLIRADVHRTMASEHVDTDHMLHVSTDITQNIAAALALGNVHFLDDYIGWMREMHRPEDLSRPMVDRYLAAYHSAIQDILGERGRLIAGWLAQQLELTVTSQ